MARGSTRAKIRPLAIYHNDWQTKYIDGLASDISESKRDRQALWREVNAINLKLQNLTDIVTNGFREIQARFGKVESDRDSFKADMKEVKADIVELKTDMREVKADIVELKSEMKEVKAEMRDFRGEIKSELKTMYTHTQILFVTAIGVVIALVAYFK